MSNEKPIIAGDASKTANNAVPDTAAADNTVKMTVEPTAKPAEPVVAKKS